MSRKPRKFTDSGIYHVILRGNNQQNLFLDSNDRFFFLERLKKYSMELNIEIYAYCLMTNHVHLLIGKATDTLSKFMQKLENSYVYYFNRKYDRTGHLFQGRFMSEPVDSDDYFKTVFRYILQNPEKSGLCKMETYVWSSYASENCVLKKSIVSSEYVQTLFGGQKNLISFVLFFINRNSKFFPTKFQ